MLDIEKTAKGILKATASEPIRDEKDIEKIKNLLNTKKQRRYYVLFVLGLNSCLRISDLLRLKISDVKTGYVRIHETKTRKAKQFKINAKTMAILENYIEEFALNDDDYLFFKTNNKQEHINRSIAYRTLVNAINTVNPHIKVGTHTLRKTASWHLYKNTNDLGLLCEILNHSSIQATRHYLGITQDTINSAFEELSL